MEAEDIEDGPEERERWQVLRQLEAVIEGPMVLLAFVWLLLVLVELVWGSSGVFELLGTLIWVIFIAEFVLRFALAPRKGRFLRRNVVTVVALLAPALRFVRALAFLRLARGLRLVRVVGTANRGLTALRRSMQRRNLGYVLVATAIVVALGAAAMLTFERGPRVENGFEGYFDALWWTAMVVSTTGSGFWPETAEGRVLALLLSVYGLAVFGYITASLASFFVGQEAEAEDGEVAGSLEVAALRKEIAALRAELRQASRSE